MITMILVIKNSNNNNKKILKVLFVSEPLSYYRDSMLSASLKLSVTFLKLCVTYIILSI